MVARVLLASLAAATALQLPRLRASPKPFRAAAVASDGWAAKAAPGADSPPESVVNTDDWEWYAANPLRRSAQLGKTAVRVAIAELRARRRVRKGDAAKAARHRNFAARRVADTCIKLGPTYVKLGQIASCRAELESTEWAAALARLQDRVPSFDSARALAQVEKELGGPLSKFFTELEPAPIAAASLGQVHRGTLLDGRVVAVKVQRPNLDVIYGNDAALLKKVATALDRFKVGGAGVQSWTTLCDDCVSMLFREIDFEQEATHAETFKANFEGFDWVMTPAVHRNLTTKRLLVMDYVPGISLRDVEAIDASPDLDRKMLAQRLAQTYFLSFCKHGFFNADPHAGNLAADSGVPGGRLIVYDFGQVAELDEQQRSGVLRAIESIIDLDAIAFVAACGEMGLLKPGADISQIEKAIAGNFAAGVVRSKLSEEKAVDAAAQAAAQKASKEVFTYFVVPPTYAFVSRALSQMQGVGTALDADFEFIAAAAPLLPVVKGTQQYMQDEFAKRVRNFLPTFQKR
ncbi:ABC1 family-domain-containing protein [Pelagophyceae sp. CCMP2097]|nr:ABC1 family-domain-containing protein [Pelagophyceae sp. CCMP2097]